MKAFISIGNYNLREQDLLFTRPLADSILKLTVQALNNNGLTIQGILSPCQLKNSFFRSLGLPVFPVLQGERLKSEREAVEASSALHPESREEWHVIVRPGLGWINEQRLAHFLQTLSKATDTSAVSILPIGITGHPLWNAFEVTNPVFAAPYTLRIPRFHFQTKESRGSHGNPDHPTLERTTTLYPKLQETLRVKAPLKGSQHLPSLYRRDDALSAFRAAPTTNSLEQETVIPAPRPTNDIPMHERLPLFELNRNIPFDLRGLNAMLELHFKSLQTPRSYKENTQRALSHA